MSKVRKNQDSDAEIAQVQQTTPANTNGASTNGGSQNTPSLRKVGQTQPAQSSGAVTVAAGPGMDTEIEDDRGYCFATNRTHFAGSYAKRSRASRTAPNGARTFNGTFKQAGVNREKLLDWFRLMDLGRITDTAAANYLKKAMGWSYHAPCAGHEGIQLAIGVSFRAKKDYLFPYYRDLMTCLAAGLTVEEIVLNGLSKDTDVAGGGRHMSNHFAKMSLNIETHSSLTDNQAQHTAGCARAIKYYKLGAVSIFSGGESGTSEGFFYESVNGSTREKIPAIFVIQNNKYGISVPVSEQSANSRVADNFRGFNNLLIAYCDGTDILDSYRAMQEAYEWCLSGRGAAMVHADCVRIGSHSNSDRQDLYRSPEELGSCENARPAYTLRPDWLFENDVVNQ